MDFEIWLYRGIIAVLFAVVWYVLKNFTKGVNEKFDKLIQKVDELIQSNATKTEQLRSIEHRIEASEKRLNDHGTRLRRSESRISQLWQKITK